MADTRFTAPVTEDLVRELASAEELLARMDGPNARLNDAAHYDAAVLQLEALAKAILTAQAGATLLGPQAPGARFHVGASSHVVRALDTLMYYLSNDASHLMRDGGSNLSKYQSENVLAARHQLAGLHGRIIKDICAVAGEDLNTVAKSGTRLLVAVADICAVAGEDLNTVAKSGTRLLVAVAKFAEEAAGDRAAEAVQMPDGSAVPGANGARCPVMLVGGNRCTKREGHRTSENQDPHAPN